MSKCTHGMLLSALAVLGAPVGGCGKGSAEPVSVAPAVQAGGAAPPAVESAAEPAAEPATVRVFATIRRDGAEVFSPVVLARLGQTAEVTGESGGVPLAWTVEVAQGPSAGSYLVRARLREGDEPELQPAALVAAGQPASVVQRAGDHEWEFELRVE